MDDLLVRRPGGRRSSCTRSATAWSRCGSATTPRRRPGASPSTRSRTSTRSARSSCPLLGALDRLPGARRGRSRYRSIRTGCGTTARHALRVARGPGTNSHADGRRCARVTRRLHRNGTRRACSLVGPAAARRRSLFLFAVGEPLPRPVQPAADPAARRLRDRSSGRSRRSYLETWYRIRPYGILVLFLLVFSTDIVSRIFNPFLVPAARFRQWLVKHAPALLLHLVGRFFTSLFARTPSEPQVARVARDPHARRARSSGSRWRARTGPSRSRRCERLPPETAADARLGRGRAAARRGQDLERTSGRSAACSRSVRAWSATRPESAVGPARISATPRSGPRCCGRRAPALKSSPGPAPTTNPDCWPTGLIPASVCAVLARADGETGDF